MVSSNGASVEIAWWSNKILNRKFQQGEVTSKRLTVDISVGGMVLRRQSLVFGIIGHWQTNFSGRKTSLSLHMSISIAHSRF